MFRLRIAAVLFLGITVSCHPKSEFEITSADLSAVPDDVISVEEMIAILTDIHLAESWVIEQKNDTIANDVKLENYYAQIYASHNISDAEFKYSFNYYSAHTSLMNYIYSKVTEELNLLESKYRNQQNPVIKKPDEYEQKTK